MGLGLNDESGTDIDVNHPSNPSADSGKRGHVTSDDAGETRRSLDLCRQPAREDTQKHTAKTAMHSPPASKNIIYHVQHVWLTGSPFCPNLRQTKDLVLV